MSFVDHIGLARWYFLILICVLPPGVVFARQSNASPDSSVVIRPILVPPRGTLPSFLPPREVKRPRVALVLSGGGARGIASIGVLKAFERANIPIDLIVGTSIGSIVGGLYCAGYSASDLQKLADTTDWSAVINYSDDASRRDLPLDQKIIRERSIFVLRFNGLEPIIPTSFASGQSLTNYLDVLALQGIYHPHPSFDDLRIPFRAVCTDLISGKQVILDRDDLGEAMRASVSVPLLFTPVRKDTMELVDGGILANLPIDVARQWGADIIVAVDVTSPLRPPNLLNAPWEKGEQLMGIMMQRANAEAIAKSDLVITPKLGNRISSDFSDPDSLIFKGEEAANQAIARLRDLIRKRGTNPARSDTARVFPHPHIKYDHEVVTGALADRLNALDSASTVSDGQLQALASDIQGLGVYESVALNLREIPGETDISLQTVPNPILRSVDIQGCSVVSAESLIVRFKPLLGRPLDMNGTRRALENILLDYRDAGYSMARIIAAQFDSTTGQGVVVMDEGTISRMDIRGTEKTKDYVIWRELPFKRGDVFQVAQVAQGMRNIYNTGLFEQTSLSIHYEGDHNEDLVVVIHARERSSELIRLGLRVDSERDFQPGIDVRDEDFLGIGAELGARAFGGDRNQSYIGEFKANRIFDTYLTFGLRGYVTSKDINVFSDDPSNDPYHFSRSRTGEFREVRHGTTANFGMLLETLGRVTIEGRLEKDEAYSIFKQPIPNQDYSISSIKFATEVDTKDRYPFPTDGVTVDFSYELASVQVGQVGYTKMMFAYEQYATIVDRHVIHPKLVVGLADETLPITEEFSLGGEDSFYGYRENNALGRQLFYASLEYLYHAPFRIIFDTYFRARYDFGSIWEKPEEVRVEDLNHGIGLGLAFDTPVGPVNLAVGRSFYFRTDLLNHPVSLGSVVFYFSIGYSLD